jgi:hypothetical protein
MDSGEASAVIFKALLEKSVSPEEAMQALLGRSPRITDLLERIEDDLAFERSVLLQYGGPGDLKLHRQYVAPLERAREEVLDRLRTSVLNSLRSAGCLAFGFRMPIDERGRPEPIAPVLWNMLELDFRNAVARGGGREYRNVRIVLLDRCAGVELARVLALIRRLAAGPDPAAKGRTASPSDDHVAAAGGAGHRRPTDQGTTDGRSFVGRTSLMRAVEQEMRRRAERDELCPTLAEQAACSRRGQRAGFPVIRLRHRRPLRTRFGPCTGS